MNEFEEKIPSEEAEPTVDEGITPEIEETTPPTPVPESRTRAALRNFFRLTLSLLIAFGLGALVIYFLYLVPAQRSLDQNTSELSEATGQIDSLNDQLDEASQTNLELEEQLNTAQAHITLLGAISDVRAANLAIANDDDAGALLYLKDAVQSLEQLSEAIGEDQEEVITAMQDDLNDIESTIRSDPDAAKTNLDRLTANLIKLESTLLK
jgi:DNA repair exonuclease SbcCD ATPase subunit